MSNKYGFSLAETLIALGILTVGMIFIAGVFPVGIYFTNLSIDRTMAAAVADEAFAKIKLYADSADGSQSLNICRLEDNEMKDFSKWFDDSAGYELNQDVFEYPSAMSEQLKNKQYYWSAICRLLQKDIDCDPVLETNRLVQVTVFVSRRAGTAQTSDFPVPVRIQVSAVPNKNNEIRIPNKDLLRDGYTIVDDETGSIYRVLKRYAAPDDDIVLLDKDWNGTPNNIWVVPPPVRGGQYPCIGVYQKIMRF
ncbi:MAG: prepilin-type N-terminal cleavage/methylation domain-containing protein [Phycisphaerae bacterium]